jgi:pantothenate kinase-related protein Tda10
MKDDSKKTVSQYQSRLLDIAAIVDAVTSLVFFRINEIVLKYSKKKQADESLADRIACHLSDPKVASCQYKKLSALMSSYVWHDSHVQIRKDPLHFTFIQDTE